MMFPRYPTFTRVIQSDSDAIAGMLKLVKRYSWDRIFVVYDHSDLWSATYANETARQAPGVDITCELGTFRGSGDESVAKAASHNIFIVVAESGTAALMPFLRAVRASSNAKGQVSVFLYALGDAVQTVEMFRANGREDMNAALDGSISLDFPTFVPGTVRSKEAAENYNATYIATFGKEPQVPFMVGAAAYHGYMRDTFSVVGYAAHACVIFPRGAGGVGCNPSNGTNLMPFLRAVDFNGITGDVNFVMGSNTRGLGSLVVRNGQAVLAEDMTTLHTGTTKVRMSEIYKTSRERKNSHYYQ